MIISRTPYRISFFGGGSDHPSYYSAFGGAVLGTTIDKYCWLTVRKSPPLGIPYKICYSKTEEVSCIGDIQHPAVRQVLIDLGCPERLEIYHSGDLPARSGVGSSSAFVVGLIKAIVTLDRSFWDADEDFGPNYWTQEKIAREAIYVERNMLKETVGDQDQLLCAYGGLNSIRFASNGKHFVEPVFYSEKDYTKCATILEQHLMLFYTRVTRTSSDVASTYVHQLLDQPHKMQELVALVEDGKDVLRSLVQSTSSANPDEFGSLLHRAWLLKKSLSATISTSEVDRLYETALENGARGGKLLGAGGGGFLLLWVPPICQEQVRKTLNLPEVPFRLTKNGPEVLSLSEEGFLEKTS